MSAMEMCPWCGHELEEGTFRSRGCNFFLPINKKLPLLYTAKSMAKKNAVPLPPSLVGDPVWPTAFICRNCKKIIIPYEEDY